MFLDILNVVIDCIVVLSCGHYLIYTPGAAKKVFVSFWALCLIMVIMLCSYSIFSV